MIEAGRTPDRTTAPSLTPEYVTRRLRGGASARQIADDLGIGRDKMSLFCQRHGILVVARYSDSQQPDLTDPRSIGIYKTWADPVSRNMRLSRIALPRISMHVKVLEQVMHSGPAKRRAPTRRMP